MNITLSRFPQGKAKALTLSFDDGRDHDRRLIQILDLYGLRGTFHLNASRLGRDGFVEPDEVHDLYENHEIAAHTNNHPFLQYTHAARQIIEVLDDRKALEALAGYPIRGFSYPFGAYNDETPNMLANLSINYGRTTQATGGFDVPTTPAEFMTWHPTCHHKNMLDKLAEFKNYAMRPGRPALFYVWGHSYEFENDKNWDLIEEFAQEAADQDDIWYATNIEIYDYRLAQRRLEFSVNNHLVRNPSAITVWIEVDEQPRELPPGTVTDLTQPVAEG